MHFTRSRLARTLPKTATATLKKGNISFENPGGRWLWLAAAAVAGLAADCGRWLAAAGSGCLVGVAVAGSGCLVAVAGLAAAGSGCLVGSGCLAGAAVGGLVAGGSG